MDEDTHTDAAGSAGGGCSPELLKLACWEIYEGCSITGSKQFRDKVGGRSRAQQLLDQVQGEEGTQFVLSGVCRICNEQVGDWACWICIQPICRDCFDTPPYYCPSCTDVVLLTDRAISVQGGRARLLIGEVRTMEKGQTYLPSPPPTFFIPPTHLLSSFLPFTPSN